MDKRLLRGAAAMLALLAAVLVAAARPALAEDGMDLTHATLVVRGGAAPLVERTAATVLAEEVEKRSGVKWRSATSWPGEGWAVALLSGKDAKLDGRQAPERVRAALAEGYGIATDLSNPAKPVLWICVRRCRRAVV